MKLKSGSKTNQHAQLVAATSKRRLACVIAVNAAFQVVARGLDKGL